MDKHLIFYVMFIPTVILFLGGMAFRMGIWLEGTLEGAPNATKWEKFRILLRRGWRRFRERPEWYIKVLIADVIFHRKLFGQSFFRWLAHTLIVFGFIVVLAVHAIKIIVNFGLSRNLTLFSFVDTFTRGSFCHLLEFLLSIFGFIILIGCLLAIIRRFLIRPDQLITEEEDIVSLIFILILGVTGFLIQAIFIASPDVVAVHDYMGEPTSNWINYWMGIESIFLNEIMENLPVRSDTLWYLHIVPSLIWFIYIPHSKLLHIFTSSVTVFADRQKELAK
jgi:nitrate reductase gamma subunit